jgi:hypothetical protein
VHAKHVHDSLDSASAVVALVELLDALESHDTRVESFVHATTRQHSPVAAAGDHDAEADSERESRRQCIASALRLHDAGALEIESKVACK